MHVAQKGSTDFTASKPPSDLVVPTLVGREQMTAQSMQPTGNPTVSPVQLADQQPSAVVLAQLDTSNTQPGAAAVLMPRGAGPATMSQVSPGVQIVRNGETLMAQPGSALQVGDKIIVPADGSAKALFQGKDGQTLVGTFEGGTQATLTQRDGDGAGAMVLDLASGNVQVAPANDGDALGLIVTKESAAARSEERRVGKECR